ncbi:helix-turn-helix domain-containing protein [uncultured Acetatifactor sp.]|uniref:helix-turn-helix domain-containing protein n=1 Tax=uncultured Acetatifactor sp. TaxID=1671927 RepID=UPI002ED4FD40
MEWVVGIQRAIDYIKDHITEELDYEEIARTGFSFSYHFQRVFSILCGYTLGEYIRSRRLTLAGMELAADKIRVIDAAVKYRYESPDSFAKAFARFHGITPSAAREPGARLRSFARLSIRISLEGGSSMDYRIEEKPEMVLTGYKRFFTGSPAERDAQEEAFYVTTRLNQYALKGLRETR